jgi:hypothetical protein
MEELATLGRSEELVGAMAAAHLAANQDLPGIFCLDGCIIRAKTNSGSGPIRTPFRFIPNKLPAESERGQ